MIDARMPNKSTDALARVAEKFGLSLIYLFGSQVETGLKLLRGESPEIVDPLADIDVGVVFKDGLPSPSERPQAYAEIYNELVDLFAPHPLDLCFLEENHSVFQSSVFWGACIYAISDDVRLGYEEMVARRAADFRPVLERYLDEILEGM